MEENEMMGQRMSHPLWYTRRMMIEREHEPKRYDELGELIQDSDGTWVSGWYTVEDAEGNTYPVKDRD